MNALEGFLTKLSAQKPENAVFSSFDGCVAAIEDCIVTATPALPAGSAGTGSPKTSWRHGERDTGSRRIRNQMNRTIHYESDSVNVPKFRAHHC